MSGLPTTTNENPVGTDETSARPFSREHVMMTHQSDPLKNDFPKLSQPAQRALAGAGYSRLEQLTHVTEADLKKLHGIGPNALQQLRAALEAQGLAFASEK